MPKGKGKKRARGDGSDDGSDGGGANDSEGEASFSDDGSDSESSSSDEERGPSGGSDEEADGSRQGARRPPVGERLKRIKTIYPTDSERTLEWMLQQVGDSDARIAAATTADLQQPSSLLCSLHDYQLVGLRWLLALHACGLSGILADEMGLGKTAQSIAMLAALAQRPSSRAPLFLVIAPLSTLSGWSEQLAAFCPSLHVVQYTGTQEARAALRASAGLGPGAAHGAAAAASSSSASAGRATVVLASYEPVLADAPELREAAWAYCVIDEAHRLKNRAAAVYRCLLDEMRLGGVPRLLLTGTPLQNQTDEFFSLLHFVAPEIYDDADGFARWMDEVGDDGSSGTTGGGTTGGAHTGGAHTGGAEAARRLWRPFMLRRLKADHLSLPPKTERTIRVPLTPMQRKWYRALLEKDPKSLGALAAASGGGGRGAPAAAQRGLVNVLASLRKC